MKTEHPKHGAPDLSLGAFKRRVEVGQQVTVVNHRYPPLSGERIVDQVLARRIATRERDKDVWWADWPKASRARIEGSTLHFLSDVDPGRVVFSYTFGFDAER